MESDPNYRRWVNGAQQLGLSDLDFFAARVRDRGDQIRRDLGAVYFLQVVLNLAHRPVAGIQRDDFFVKTRPAGLVFGVELGIKAAMAVAGCLDGQLAEIALEGLSARAAADVAVGVGDSRMAIMANQVFRLLVADQQAGQPFLGYGVG